MFNSLRRKIITIIMSALTILIVSILIAIYMVNYLKSTQNTELILRKLCWQRGFELLQTETDKISPSTYYLVQVEKDNQTILRMSNDKNSGYTDQELSDMALEVIQRDNTRGEIENLSYYKAVRIRGTYISFFNTNSQKSYFNTLFYTILIFGLIGLVLLFLISIWLSKWLITPIEETFHKQKQFISDASHELKTPITIISSNVDALERENGESKWIDYIRSETLRMNRLISDLLQLATLDFDEDRSIFTRIDFSELVMSTTLPFESVAYEKQIGLEEAIDENIYILGDSIKLAQLIVILIDNALNYTEPEGKIRVELKKYREKRILTVSNTGKEIPASERELIFERFYRVNKARTREKGNYGLGLSIAKSITQLHNGRISVCCKNNTTIFKVTL